MPAVLQSLIVILPRKFP